MPVFEGTPVGDDAPQFQPPLAPRRVFPGTPVGPRIFPGTPAGKYTIEMPRQQSGKYTIELPPAAPASPAVASAPSKYRIELPQPEQSFPDEVRAFADKYLTPFSDEAAGAKRQPIKTVGDFIAALGSDVVDVGKMFTGPVVRGVAELLDRAHGNAPGGNPLAPLSPDAVAALAVLVPEASVVPRGGGARPVPAARERIEPQAPTVEIGTPRPLETERVPDDGGPIISPVLGKRGVAAADRTPPSFTPEELARARTAPRPPETEIMGRVVPAASREGSAFTDQELARAAGARAAAQAAAEPPLPTPRRPTDLIEFLARGGGLKEEGGELRARDAHKRFVPGAGMLVRKQGGLSLDAAREVAEEAGYLKPGSDINDLLDALGDNLRGKRVFSERDLNEVQDWQQHETAQREPERGPADEMTELQQRARDLGIRVTPDATHEELLAQVHEREGMMAEGEAVEPHADALQAEINRSARRGLPDAKDAIPFFGDEVPIIKDETRGRAAEAGGVGASREGSQAAGGTAPGGEGTGARAAGGSGNAGAGEPPGGIGGGPPRTPRQQPLPMQPAPRPGVFRAAAGTIEKIFSPTTVSAASRAQEGLMRESIGTAERATQQARAELDQYRGQVGALSPKDQFDFVGYVEGRSKGAALRDPALQPAADALRSLFAKRQAELHQLPSTAQAAFVEDYFPHAWTDPQAARQVAQQIRTGSGRQGSGGFLKQRTIPTVADGLAAGLTPKYPNPLDATFAYVVNADRYIAINRAFDIMRDNGTARYFAPGTQPDGWLELRGRLAEKAAPVGEGEAMVMKAYAPEDAARVWNNFIGRGWHDVGPVAGQVYEGAQRAMNSITMAELSFSAFHASTMAQEAVVSAVARAIGQVARGEIVQGVKSLGVAPIEPLRSYWSGRKLERQYLGLHDYGPDLDRIVTLGTKAGMRAVGRGREYLGSGRGSFVPRGAPKRFFEAWRKGMGKIEVLSAGRAMRSELGAARAEIAEQPVFGTIRILARNMARLMDTVSAPLFDDVIPRLKDGAFYADMKDWLAAHPASSPEEQLAAARQVWDSIDNRFGELVMDDLFWSRMLKQSLQLMTRSVGWDLGTLREIGGGAVDIARGARNIVRGKGVGPAFGRDMSPRAKYVIALPIVTGVANAVLQYLKTGKGPDKLADLYAYRTGGRNEDGSEERAMIPGYMRDVLGYIHDTPGEIWGKAATGVHVVYDLLTNRNFRGLAIGDPEAGLFSPQARQKLPSFLLAYLQHVAEAYEPIMVKSAPKVGSNISLPERALAIRPAPFYIQNPSRLEEIERGNAAKLKKQQIRSDTKAQWQQPAR